MAGNKHGIFTGARAVLSIANKVIGFATNCSGSEDIEYIPIVTLNSVQVREFVPVGYTVTFSASKVFIFSQSVKKQSLFPPTAGKAEDHIRNILATAGDDGLTVQIIDEITKETFMTLEGASIASRSWSFGARDIIGEDVAFVGIRMFEEIDSGGGLSADAARAF